MTDRDRLRLLRHFGAVTLAMRANYGGGESPVLVVSVPAGDLLVRPTRKAESFEARGEGLRLRGAPRDVTFTLYAATRSPPFSEQVYMRAESITRSDQRACTRAQQSALDDVAQEVFELAKPYLGALQAATEWVRADERVKVIGEELVRLMAERAELEVKLAGPRPW